MWQPGIWAAVTPQADGRRTATLGDRTLTYPAHATRERAKWQFLRLALASDACTTRPRARAPRAAHRIASDSQAEDQTDAHPHANDI